MLNSRSIYHWLTTLVIVLVPVMVSSMAATIDRSTPAPIDVADFQPFDEKSAALGRLLFYDKILSGNRNISCGTCHNHDHASTDGLSLGIGEGGIGLGPKRRLPAGRDVPQKRVPRNANALFNLGHKDFKVLFHDGRASRDNDNAYGKPFNTPAEEWLPEGLTSLAAAQALFPVTSRTEMAGDPHENEVAAARRERIDHVWPILARRVSAVTEYEPLFVAAFDDVASSADITMTHIANAIGDFVNGEWQSYSSPFDDYLRGRSDALSRSAKIGMQLFYGKARCASCHAGALLTDQKFYSLAMPPFGPGRTRPFDPYARDVGRMGETDQIEDAYRFRTPSLRNVAHTGPWGHNGAYATLEGVVRHHLDPLRALKDWDRSQVKMPMSQKFAQTDFAIWEDSREMTRLMASLDIEPISLSNQEILALLAFLDSLNDEKALKGRLGKPMRVPSGLSID